MWQFHSFAINATATFIIFSFQIIASLGLRKINNFRNKRRYQWQWTTVHTKQSRRKLGQKPSHSSPKHFPWRTVKMRNKIKQKGQLSTQKTGPGPHFEFGSCSQMKGNGMTGPKSEAWNQIFFCALLKIFSSSGILLKQKKIIIAKHTHTPTDTHTLCKVVRPAKSVLALVHLAAGDQRAVADCFLV